MITVGVIGHGYWGPNLVRNFMDVGVVEYVAPLGVTHCEPARALERVLARTTDN
jgi:hypothetical protein